MSADLAVQAAIRTRLTSTSAVTALVPATAILDRHQRPAPSPSIILGETQGVDEGASIARRRERIYHTIHVWKREPSLEGVKAIAGAIRTALHTGRMALGPSYYAADARVSGTLFLRDPDGETSHAVVTVEILAAET